MLPVGTGSVPAGSAAVARFDPADGLPALTVVQPRAVPPDHAAVVRRRELARALLANPETLAPRPAAEALAAGEVDPRLIVLLAGIGWSPSAVHPIRTVRSTGLVEDEAHRSTPSAPRPRPGRTPMARLTRALLLALLAAGLTALGTAPAAAAPGDPADGLVRMMHLSPDTPPVDAYIDSVSSPGTQVVLPAVSYGDVSPYQSLPAGTYTVSARTAGADPADPPALASTVTVEAGRAVTIAGVGAFADLGFAVLADDLALPPAGQARARVVNAAATASPLDLALAGSGPVATGLAFPDDSGYVDVPGGAGTFTVSAAGTAAELPVDLSAGSVYTVLVLDREGGGVTLETALDAASPGIVPTGGVEAGAGGTAPGGVGVHEVGLAVAAAAAIALLLTGLLRRPDRLRAPRHTAS